MEEAPCPSATDGRVLAEGCELDGQSTLHQRAGSRRALAQRKHCVGELHGHVSFRSAFRPALLVASDGGSLHRTQRIGQARGNALVASFSRGTSDAAVWISAQPMNQDFISSLRWMRSYLFECLSSASS